MSLALKYTIHYRVLCIFRLLNEIGITGKYAASFMTKWATRQLHCVEITAREGRYGSDIFSLGRHCTGSKFVENEIYYSKAFKNPSGTTNQNAGYGLGGFGLWPGV